MIVEHRDKVMVLEACREGEVNEVNLILKDPTIFNSKERADSD